MKLKNICEQRKNAKHPAQKKAFGRDIFKDYENLPTEELNNLFISFTKVDKLGVNPQSTYNTPIGIYTYPLRYVMDKQRPSHVPFAGSSPYMWIVKAIKPVLVLNGYDNLRTDQTKAVEYLTTQQKMSNSDAVAFVNSAISGAKYSKTNMDASRFWNIARLIASNTNGTGRRIDSSGYPLPNDTIQFNTILRKVFGYFIINDPGLGIIHPSEPTQCVFLTKDSLSVIDKLRNNPDQHDIEEGPHTSAYWINIAYDKVKNNLPDQLKFLKTVEDKAFYIFQDADGTYQLSRSQHFAMIDACEEIISHVDIIIKNIGLNDTRPSVRRFAKKISADDKVEQRLINLRNKCKDIIDASELRITGST